MKNEIDSVFDEAIKLMEAAIKKYKEGDFEIANKRRHSANKLFQKAHASMDTEEGQDDMVYGESRNFGKIFKVFESNTNRLFETKDGSIAAAKIINTIKNDKDLSTEFKLYEAIENPKNVIDAKEYVDGVVALAESFNCKNLKDKHKNLLEQVRKYSLDENISLDYETEKLYESIDYIINNRNRIENVGEMISAKNTILEFVKNAVLENTIKIDEAAKKAVSNIEEKYDGILNEDEKEFINELSKPGVNLKNVFEATKKKLQTSIMESMLNEPENYNSWKELLERVKSKTYSDKTAIQDIAEMVESQNIIK